MSIDAQDIAAKAAAFEASLRQSGTAEIVRVERPAGEGLDSHTHPFAATALVLQGDITLTVDGVVTRYDVGDVFELAADEPHEERYGSDGVTYLVGRR